MLCVIPAFVLIKDLGISCKAINSINIGVTSRKFVDEFLMNAANTDLTFWISLVVNSDSMITTDDKLG